MEQVKVGAAVDVKERRGASKEKDTTIKEIERVAESLGTVALTRQKKGNQAGQKGQNKKGKWGRQKVCRKVQNTYQNRMEVELGKRQLVDVEIYEGNFDDIRKGMQRRRLIEEQIDDKKIRGGTRCPPPPMPMKLVSWNCKVLGNPQAVRALSRLIRLENPHLVFIMETRLKEGEMDRIRQRCGFNSCLTVACNGNGRDRAGARFALEGSSGYYNYFLLPESYSWFM